MSVLLGSPAGLVCTTAAIVLLGIFTLGTAFSWLLRLKGFDVIEKLCTAMDVPPFWRACSVPNIALSGFKSLSYCDPGVVGVIETALIGSLVAGFIGLLAGLVREAVGPNNNMFGLILGPIGWIASMDDRARVRVALALGSMLAVCHIYTQVSASVPV